MNRTVILLVFAWLPVLVSGQHGLSLEIRLGLESGWWTYDKGSTVEGLGNTEGWDRTRHSAFLPAALGLWYDFGKCRLGAGASIVYFDEWSMLSNDSRLISRNIYSIADRAVVLFEYYMQVEADLFRGKRFSGGPQLVLGSFQIGTTHPQRDNFGFRLTLQGAFLLRYSLGSRWEVWLAPVWKRRTIWPAVRTVFHEQHELQSYGINGGVRFKLWEGKQ